LRSPPASPISALGKDDLPQSALALKTLPIGTAYAVWTDIGAAGTALLGTILFGEPAAALRLVSIGLVVAGVVGLKLVT
jgi:quaternary ammonium compound-resistance protein SugE